jgi:hypothetical protein
MHRKAQAHKKLTLAQSSAGTTTTVRPAALNPAAMMNHAATNMAGPVVIDHRMVALLTAIPAAIAAGTPVQLAIGHRMAAQVATGIAMTGHAAIVPVMIVIRVIVRKATARHMAILVATVTGTPTQRVVGLAVTASRNGAVMARRPKGAILTRIVPRMAAHRGVRLKRVAPELAAVVTWTRAQKRPFALKPGLKIVHSNVALAIMRTPVDSALAVNSHLSQAAKRSTVMAAMPRCAGKGQRLLARNQAVKLHMQMALPAALPVNRSANPRRRKQPLQSLQVRQDVALTSSAPLANAF